MSFWAILLLALGLAMDASAVSASRGMALSVVRPVHVLLVSCYFGGFQALMPLIGWLFGTGIGPLVQAWDHWIAFVLLSLIGGKMFWESCKQDDVGIEQGVGLSRDRELFSVKVMLALAVATSIDALAVGITLPMIDAPLGLSVLTIGVTTAVLSAIGLFAGRRFGVALGRRMDAAGGIVLVGLGIKIVLQHTWWP